MFVSEKVVAYELGYRAQLGSQGVRRPLGLLQRLYWTSGARGFTPRTILPFFFANNLAGETHGLEFNGSYQALPWWQLRAGYDLLKGEHRGASRARRTSTTP